MAFWDTSALVKLYVRERDSSLFRELIRTSTANPTISELTVSEMHRALWAKVLARVVPADLAEKTFREFCDHIRTAPFKVIPIGTNVQGEFDRILQICYRARPPIPIRTLDGLLLASALVARTPELVSTDSRMRQAGPLLSLRVLPT